MDIDDLVDFINDPKTKEKPSKKKGKNKKVDKPIKSNEIVETFDSLNLVDKNAKDEGINVVNTYGDEKIDLNTNRELNNEDESKKAKKKRKRRRGNKDEDEDDDTEELKKERAHTYRKFFNFKEEDINKSRFQDMSMFRVLHNWEDKPWNQTLARILNLEICQLRQ